MMLQYLWYTYCQVYIYVKIRMLYLLVKNLRIFIFFTYLSYQAGFIIQVFQKHIFMIWRVYFLPSDFLTVFTRFSIYVFLRIFSFFSLYLRNFSCFFKSYNQKFYANLKIQICFCIFIPRNFSKFYSFYFTYFSSYFFT